MKLLKNQRGDTIVEVLISITILSAVLAITYSLATRAFRTMQVARDQMQAVLIAQEQLEAVTSIHREVRGANPWARWQSTMGTTCSGSAINTATGTTFLMRVNADTWCVEPSGPHPDPRLTQLYTVEDRLSYITNGAGAYVGVTVTSTVKWTELGTGLNRELPVTVRLR